MNEVTFHNNALSKHEAFVANETLKTLVRYLARCEAEKDYHQQQECQRKDH